MATTSEVVRVASLHISNYGYLVATLLVALMVALPRRVSLVVNGHSLMSVANFTPNGVSA